jgi:hypothetical protein
MQRYGRRSVVLAAIGALALWAFAPSPAAAEPVLDANCPGPPTTQGGLTANQRIAQTFTAQTTGTLVRGEIEVTKPPMTTGDWVMEIYATDGSGNPTNTLLASTTIADATVPTGNSRLVGAPFTTPASVQAGQQYALSLRRSASWSVRDRGGNPCPGVEFFSGSSNGSWVLSNGVNTLDLVFAVFVEPAPPPSPPPPSGDGPGDSSAPETTITKGPPNKTKKKAATFEFTGVDTRAIASFQCKLDAGAFAPCTSPHTVKVKKGKHTFQVQAIDQAGNVGTPATDTWKRKKKKKKK